MKSLGDFRGMDRILVECDGTLDRYNRAVLEHLLSKALEIGDPLSGMDTRGNVPNVPKFAKRLRAHLYKEHGIEIDQSLLDVIANWHGEISRPISVYADVNFSLSWNSGDFGDRGSCFWGMYRSHRQLLQDAEAGALRFWEEGEGKCGFGRAWLLDTRYIDCDAPDPIVCIFNPYTGKEGQHAEGGSLPYATVLREILGADSMMYIGGMDIGEVYLNGATPMGVFDFDDIGDAESLVESDAERLLYKYNREYAGRVRTYCIEFYLGETGVACCHCGDHVEEDDVIYDNCGDAYCQDCYYEVYSSCDRCGNDFARDDSDAVYVDDSCYCCETCAERAGYTRCQACGDWNDTGPLCERCAEDNVICENCDGVAPMDDAIITRDGECLCSSCASSYATCADCEEIFDPWENGAILLQNGDTVCKECAKSYCCCAECGQWTQEYTIHCGDMRGSYSPIIPRPVCQNCANVTELPLRDDMTMESLGVTSYRDILRNRHVFTAREISRLGVPIPTSAARAFCNFASELPYPNRARDFMRYLTHATRLTSAIGSIPGEISDCSEVIQWAMVEEFDGSASVTIPEYDDISADDRALARAIVCHAGFRRAPYPNAILPAGITRGYLSNDIDGTLFWGIRYGGWQYHAPTEFPPLVPVNRVYLARIEILQV